jgi:O-antigen ligase
MLNKFVVLTSDFFIFLLVFSFFNDNYIVDTFGPYTLKFLLVAFSLLYLKRIWINSQTMPLLSDKLFFIFFLSLNAIFLIGSLFDQPDNLVTNGLLLFSILIIVIYFRHYPMSKLLYFIWASMMISVVICYFNDSISEWTFRKTGGTADPNEFAAQLLVFLFASFYLYSINKSRVFLGISLLFFLYGLFYAGSMSSFLVLGIIAAFYAISQFRIIIKNLLNYKGFIFAVAFLSIFAWVDFAKIEAVSNMLGRTEQTGTANTRLNSWIAGFHMIEENPILGVGVNNYAENTRKYSEVYLNDDAIAPHNLFVKIAAESGVIVFVLLIVFLGILFLKNFKSIFHSTYLPIWLMAFSVTLMGLSLGITFSKYFWLVIAGLMQVNFLLKKDSIRS